jgi:uncharacterized metal-binding protein YceD (DUF177 family)
VLVGVDVELLQVHVDLVLDGLQAPHALPREHGRGRAREQHAKATEHDDRDLDDETSLLEDDMIDLEPLLRDAVVLALPFQPLCQDDCPGLCTECGARLADDPDHTHGAPIDPRWAGLEKLQQGAEDHQD